MISEEDRPQLGIGSDAEARQLVVEAINQAVAEGRLTEQDAAYQRERAGQFPSTFELSEWVRGNEVINRKFCNYPECFKPPKPPAVPGTKSYYCDTLLAPGKYAHDANTSQTRRTKLKRAISTPTPKPAALVTISEPGPRPVQLARMTLPDLVAQILYAIQEVSQQVTQVNEHVHTVVDPESSQIEIDTISQEFDRQLNELNGKLLATQREARAAGEAVNTMAAQLAEADAATEAANAAVAVANEERDGANQALREALAEQERIQTQARADIQTAENNATQAIADAEERFNDELDRRATEMDQQVKAANRTRDDAIADAAERVETARIAEERAAQAVDDANAERDTLRAQVAELTKEIRQLNAASLQRELAHQDTISQINRDNRSEVEALRTRLEEERASHTTTLRTAQSEAQQELTRRLDELNDSWNARISAVESALAAAEGRATLAENELNRLHQARAEDNSREKDSD